MAESVKKESNKGPGPAAPARNVSADDRFRFIGFEVFPRKVRDLFKSDAEKDKLVAVVRARRQQGHVLRDECTLVESRVSASDRIVMTVACLVMLVSLFIPWFSAYNEVEDKPAGARQQTVSGTTAGGAGSQGQAVGATSSGSEEVITGYVARKKTHREYGRLSGLGTIASIGAVGSRVFSSGLGLMFTGLLFLVFLVATLVLPIHTLYVMYKEKGDPDQKALKLKRILRFNWLPVGLFGLALIVSFVGASYGFEAKSLFTSLGDSYNVAVYLNTLSWGVFLSIGASILLAAKGAEI